MTGSSWLGQLRRYSVVGVVSNICCYLVFLGLLRLRTTPVAATALCYLLGVAISYSANRRWTFRSRNRHRTDAICFAGAYTLGLAFSMAAMALLVRSLPPAAAQVVVVVATATVIFTCLRVFGFGRSQAAGAGGLPG